MHFVNDDIPSRLNPPCLPIFQGSLFSKIYTSVLVNCLTINFTIISFKSKAKFSVILLLRDLHFLLFITKHKFKDG